jgi:hypothetical protein
VQLKDDWDNEQWVTTNVKAEQFKALLEAMKDKRPIHARLTGQAGGDIKVSQLRVSFNAVRPG